MTEKPSILVMNNGYLASSLSGGTRNALDIAKEQAKEHDVSFILPEFAKSFLPEGVSAITYPSTIPNSLAGIVFTYLSRMLKASSAAKNHPADIVLCSSSLLHDMLPAWVHRLKHGSHMAVFVYHLIPKRDGKTIPEKIQFFLSSLAQRICIGFYKSSDTVFAGNSLVRQQLIELGIDENRIEIYFPAVRIEEIQAAEPRSEYDLLFVGRLVARKGIFDLIEAVESLDVTVGIIGEGESREDVKKSIEEKGMSDRVTLLGGLPDKDMFSLLRGCKAFVFPSYEEGYGIALAEALSAGVPVVTYELPHYREAFEDMPIYVPLGDVMGLSYEIKDAINSKCENKALCFKINSSKSAANKVLDIIFLNNTKKGLPDKSASMDKLESK